VVALSFNRDADAVLTIPARIVGRGADGAGWITHIGPPLESVPALRPRASRYAVQAVEAREWWEQAVATALTEIRTGRYDKVVLAREVLVEADTPFDPRAVLRRLRSQQPGCILYADGGFVGATPELLVRRTGSRFESRPMAGTAPGSAAAEVAARLSASGKDAREHRFVVDAVRAAFAPVADTIAVPDAPVVEHFGSLAHLVTPIGGSLAAGDSADAPSALDLARLLHPSPAVGGTPTDAALHAIRRLEPFDRGPYAGPVGWVDARGDGAFAVALRGAQLDGPGRCCGPAPGSWPGPTPTRSGPRRWRSSSPCSAPSSSPEPPPRPPLPAPRSSFRACDGRPPISWSSVTCSGGGRRRRRPRSPGGARRWRRGRCGPAPPGRRPRRRPPPGPGARRRSRRPR